MIALIIVIKVFYIVSRNFFINYLFNNVLNVNVKKFNELFFYFLFFENIILWYLITSRRSKIYI